MKKLAYMILAAAVLAGGLAGCGTKEQETVKAVDLRFRAEDSYDLAAVSANPFTILVVSSDPWTVRSEHPTWCIISDEEGEASDAALVFLGKAEPTSIKIQYYDNPDLDDREDVIEIKSDYWVGKRIKVYQKGIAYLEVPEEESAIYMPKAGGEFSFHVNSNQNWTAVVTEGDWLTITQGSEGSLDGQVTAKAGTNSGEMRYAYVTVYDRHGEEMAVVKFTQDGVQLEPATLEVRSEWDQSLYELEVAANVGWTAAKKEGCEGDDWYSIENPENNGSGKLRILLQPNEDGYIRDSRIVLKSVAGEGEFQAVKEILIRQAYKVVPVRHVCDEDEMARWSVTNNESSGWINSPSFNGTGMLLPSGTQLHLSMDPPGLYTFHWTEISADARVRLWYSISSQEIKYNFEKGSAQAEGNSNFGSIPSKSQSYDASVTTHEIGIGFSPAAGGFCHVSVYFDGVEFNSFDTSASLGSNYTWGTKIDVYIGVDHGTAGVDSAVLEWYEFTAPFSWGDEE